MLYNAFISYSHAADDKLAPAIQRGLHQLAKPWYRLRALRAFRDKTSLAANPALWNTIVQALADSEWFLFMASPQAAQSRWVGQEIAWWTEHRRSDRLLIVLTDGELAWDDAANDFDWDRTSSVPATLKGRFTGEPLYVDLRWARSENNLSLRHSQFRAAILDIAAPVHGRAKDELDGDDVRQYRKTRRLAWAGVAGLAALAAAATVSSVIAVQQRNQAELRRQLALSRQISAQSLNRLADDRVDVALLLALEAHNVLAEPAEAAGPGGFDARSSLLAALDHGAVPIVAYLRGGGPMALSADGRTLALARADAITLWDTATHRPAGPPLPSHGNPVFGLAFSPDGRFLASSSRSQNNLVVWNLATRSPAGPPLTAHDGSAVSLAISPDGKTLASGGGDQAVRLWKLGGDNAIAGPIGEPLPGHTSNVVSLAFSHDGRMLATGSWDGTVILRNASTGLALLPPLSVSRNQIESVAFSPDGRTLAAGGSEGAVLWDLATGQALMPVLNHPGGVKSVAFSSDGRLLASGGGAGTLRLWNVNKREPVGPPLRGHLKWIENIVFTPDGQMLVSSGDDSTILWDLTRTRRLATVLPGPAGSINALSFSHDGSLLASGTCLDAADNAATADTAERARSPHWALCRQGGVRLVQQPPGKDREHRQDLPTLLTHSPGTPRSLVFMRETNTLAVAGCAKLSSSDCSGIAVETWRPGAGRLGRSVIEDDSPKLATMALSPRGDIVAAAGCQWQASSRENCDAGEIRLWRIETGRPLGAPLIGHQRGVTQLAFSPDGQTLASGTLDDVILWNVGTGRPRGRPQPGSVSAFSSDGKVVAVAPAPGAASPRTIVLRDMSTNQPVGEITIGDADVVLAMAFSPDARTLAISNAGPGGPAFTFWDVARAERLGPPMQWPGGRAFVLAFNPDGKTVATGSEDGRLAVWDIDPASWRERACRIANRNLTYEEWAQFLGDEPYRMTCAGLPADPGIVEAGRRHARSGDLDGAITILRRALKLDPALRLDPRKEAVKSSVDELVAHGSYLAAAGDVQSAAASFERARALDPDLPFEPTAHAKKLAAPGLVAAAAQFARQGKVADAMAGIERARQFDAAVDVPAAAWSALCWSGALRGQAAAVSAACDKAVAGGPDDGRALTGRAVARAMAGRTEEAKADIAAFLAWEQREQGKRMGLARREWLSRERLRHAQWQAALQAGRNPFTPDELKRLLTETQAE